MKTITLTLGVICLIANILFGLILTSYESFNVWLNSFVILLNTLLLYLVNCINLKDAYKVSLNGLFPVFSIAEFIGGLFAPARYENNFALIIIILALAFEAALLVITYKVSN